MQRGIPIFTDHRYLRFSGFINYVHGLKDGLIPALYKLVGCDSLSSV